MNLTTKKILVAGGAGFIGVHLCKRLLTDGHQVISVDNLSTGTSANVKLLTTFTNFRFYHQDIIEPFDFGYIDEIYNLACPASPSKYQKNPINTLRTSIWGTYNLLQLARKYQAKFLLASTSEVYGNPLVHPQTENYWGNVNPIGVRACYDEGKRAAEALTMDFYREYGVEVKIARIFNTYGPYMDPQDGRVISNFITQALLNQPLTIYGSGEQTRSFQYIDDLVQGLLLMMASSKEFTGPVNFGNPVEFKVLDLARLILKLIPKSKSTLIYKPLPPDDPVQRRPDISLAQEKLAWQPKIFLEEGLIKTIAYFEQKLLS